MRTKTWNTFLVISLLVVSLIALPACNQPSPTTDLGSNKVDVKQQLLLQVAALGNRPEKSIDDLLAVIAADDSDTTNAVSDQSETSPERSEELETIAQAEPENDSTLAIQTPTTSEPEPTPSTPERPDTDTVTRGSWDEQERVVVGYYTYDYTGDVYSQQSFAANAATVDIVSPFQVKIDSSGNITSHSMPGLVDTAENSNTSVMPLVHNFSGGSFSASVAHSLLSSEANRTKAINNLYNFVENGGYDGITIDIEGINPSDRPYYTAFIKELKAKFGPHGLAVTLAIPAKTADMPTAGWVGGFDYAELGKYADAICLMTYDEHWFGGTAGPIASIGWVENVIKYAVTQIPRDKILLGIAGYGYDWAASGTQAVSVSQAYDNADRYGATIQWDATAGVPYYNYWISSTKHTVYFENKASIDLKLDLVTEYDLGGVGLWKLGTEDQAIWPSIAQELK